MPALLEMNTTPAELEAAERKPAMRFTYASGSRPLEGYTIKRGVGRGGFGEVYFAVSDAGKEVALKLIRRNLEVELRGVTHCLNLKHPNLIDIYDIRTDEHDDRWVVMEYVNGQSLEDAIDKYPDGMPKEVAMHWFEGICAGVAYLHDHGIVHRDLKPANIFLDNGRVKIGDYGLSKFISCSRRSGQTESVGTVHYMAPEIANGRYGREIDAYALGIILFEMLTGHVPFEGESVGEVLMKHLTAEPDLGRLEEPFRGVVQGAMAKDPERRIDSAAQMIAMLGGAAPLAGVATLGDFAAKPQAGAPGVGSPWIDPPTAARAAAQPLTPPQKLRAFFHRDPEPVMTGLRRARAAMAHDLNWDGWSAPSKLASGVILFVLFMVTWPLWLMAVAAYVTYWVFRQFVQFVTDAPVSSRPQATPLYRPASPATPAEFADAAPTIAAGAASRDSDATLAVTAKYESKPRRWRRRGQASWRFAAYQELAAQPVRRRASTILSSMLLAAAIAPVASLLACLFTIRDFNPELFLWASIVGTLAAWSVIIPGQLAEGRVEDQAPMRFIALLTGAFVGFVAWGATQAMYLDLPSSQDFIRPDDTLSSEMLGWRSDQMMADFERGAVAVPLAHFAAYFAFLFALLRWWKVAEWTRPTRVSFWAIAWAGAAAFCLSFIWWFPQPLGVLTAAVVSFTVQLASPWLPPSRRKDLAHAAIAV